jgi:hypothetical protein
MREYANAAVALSRQIADGASSDSLWQRWMFRQVLKVAGVSNFVMKRTIGKSAFGE